MSLASLCGRAALAIVCFTVAFAAAPRSAQALFEEDAYVSSWESFEQSYSAYAVDGGSIENSYHYYLAIYSYYGYYFAAYGYFYGSDVLIGQARDYHDTAYRLADALLYYGVGGLNTYLAKEAASQASTACFWASLL